MTLKELLAAIELASGVPHEAALQAASAACSALRLNPDAIIPTVELSRPTGDNAKPDDVKLEAYQEYVEAGGVFSERAMSSGSQYWEQGKSRRFCHMTAGGCGAAETENVPMHHGNKDGPKFKVQSGEWKGKPYSPNMHPACLARLQEMAAGA